MERLLWIGIGGFVGANARYLVSTWVVTTFAVQTALGTLVVNAMGSLGLGVLTGWMAARGLAGLDIPQNVVLLVGTGFFGAYTTFSTYAVETALFARGGDAAWAIANVVGMNVLCLLLALAGVWVGGRLVG